MRVLAWVHLYPPDHCAGAEMMLHEILLGLRARGHTATVICDRTSSPIVDGVTVHGIDTLPPDRVNALIDAHDIVVTHLDRTRQVINTVKRRKPIVHLIHNDRQLTYHRVRPPEAQLVVANSQWILKAIKWRGPSIVVHPPVHANRYHTGRGNRVTLINLSAEKGAATFWALAERMPERKFLGVVGGYGVQVIPDQVPANVDIVQHTANIRDDVYARTRILLTPSGYESWGRVGIEAAASGIPTIAHPTPGLLESLAGAGVFLHRDDIDSWVREIRCMDNPAVYAGRVVRALLRSEELDPTDDIDRLEAAMTELTPKGT